MLAEAFSRLRGLDGWAFLLVNRSLQNPVCDVLMPILSTKRYILFPAAVAVMMLLVWGGRRMWIVVAVGVAALVLTDLCTNLIKASLQRVRPCHVIPAVHLLTGCTRSFSLPSNHASNMFAIATVGWWGFRRYRWALFILAAGVAYSRVYLGAHYPADVLAGALLGMVVAWACARCASRIWPGLLDAATRQPRSGQPEDSPDRACRQ